MATTAPCVPADGRCLCSRSSKPASVPVRNICRLRSSRPNFQLRAAPHKPTGSVTQTTMRTTSSTGPMEEAKRAPAGCGGGHRPGRSASKLAADLRDAAKWHGGKRGRAYSSLLGLSSSFDGYTPTRPLVHRSLGREPPSLDRCVCRASVPAARDAAVERRCGLYDATHQSQRGHTRQRRRVGRASCAGRAAPSGWPWRQS